MLASNLLLPEQMRTPRVLALDNTSDGSDTGRRRKGIQNGPSVHTKQRPKNSKEKDEELQMICKTAEAQLEIIKEQRMQVMPPGRTLYNAPPLARA